MAYNDKEIEIQVRIENKKALLFFLENNAKFEKENHQIDEYFSPLDKDFTTQRPIKEWLRLRTTNNHYTLNYKNWFYNETGQSSYCDEYETAIEDYEKFKKILLALNFRVLTRVDKLRKTWHYQNYEIAIDSIKGLGNFVEIEYIGQEKNVNPEEVTRGMIDFLKNIGCGRIERNYVGYPFQLLFPRETKFEEQ